MTHEEGLENIYSDIKNIVARKNGNDVCKVLSKVLADIITMYCDKFDDDSDFERMVDSIGVNIKEQVKCNRKLKEL